MKRLNAAIINTFLTSQHLLHWDSTSLVTESASLLLLSLPLAPAQNLLAVQELGKARDWGAHAAALAVCASRGLTEEEAGEGMKGRGGILEDR